MKSGQYPAANFTDGLGNHNINTYGESFIISSKIPIFLSRKGKLYNRRLFWTAASVCHKLTNKLKCDNLTLNLI